MSEQLDNKIKEISEKYRDLKKCDNLKKQMVLIGEMKTLCLSVDKLLDKENPSPQNFRRKKQIDDIRMKIAEIQIKNKENQLEIKPIKPIEKSNRMSRNEMSRKLARTILFEEIRSTQMKISPKDLESIAERMQKNVDVMKEINLMIEEQGEDLEQLQNNIKSTYQNAKNANEQLQEADRLKTQTRLMKIRLGVTGLFGTIGAGLLGLPGMIVGLFAGFKVSKS